MKIFSLANTHLLKLAILSNICTICLLCSPVKAETVKSVDKQDSEQTPRIITLSPHLTELVYSLDKGDHLVAVSDYSDFPEAAQTLPSVASYQGANIAEILRLKPSHILVWRGGNKDADIQKLNQQGLHVYESKISNVEDLLEDIKGIGIFINAQDEAKTLTSKTSQHIIDLQSRYSSTSLSAIYYLNSQPLVGLGNDSWLNSLLDLCNIQNVYRDSISAYPQLKISDVLRKQVKVIIAATSQDEQDVKRFWAPHQDILSSKIMTTNPNAMHRFTTRAIDETQALCARVHQTPTL